MWRRLLRPNAQSVDRTGIDEISPPQELDDPRRYVERTPPNNFHAIPATIFRGTVPGPRRLSRPVQLPRDGKPDLRTTYYSRARHGEGLFGIEPLYPEGEAGS